jgi:hypothetical protein
MEPDRTSVDVESEGRDDGVDQAGGRTLQVASRARPAAECLRQTAGGE